MKKILLSTLLAAQIGFIAVPNNALAYDVNSSELSLMSGASMVLSVVLIPVAILDDLSSSSSRTNTINNTNITNNYVTPTKMTVKEISYPGNGNAKIKTTVSGDKEQDIVFELPEKSVKKCAIETGTEIKVDKSNVGYTLNANDKVIGIVPNEKGTQYFKQQKQ